MGFLAVCTGELWELQLNEVNLSQNPRLEHVLLSVLEDAARCPTLKTLRLQAIVETRAGHGGESTDTETPWPLWGVVGIIALILLGQ